MNQRTMILPALLMMTGLWLALPQTPIAAAPPAEKPAAGDSLDDELLKGLGESAEEERLGDIQTPAKEKAPADRPPASKTARQPDPAGGKAGARSTSGNELDDELLKGLGEGEDVELGGKPQGGAAGGDQDNPFADLEKKMREVEGRIAATQSDETTQRLQTKITAELEQLIKELQKRKKSSSSSSSSKQDQQTAEREKIDQPDASEAAGKETASNDPAKDSSKTMANRKTATPEAAQLDEALKDIWGQLPAHLRQQMEQYAKEELLPKYELQIEEYFRALAKGQRERPN